MIQLYLVFYTIVGMAQGAVLQQPLSTYSTKTMQIQTYGPTTALTGLESAKIAARHERFTYGYWNADLNSPFTCDQGLVLILTLAPSPLFGCYSLG